MRATQSTSHLPPMWLRVALAMLPVLFAVLLLLGGSALALIERQDQRQQDQRLAGMAARVGSSVRDRIAIADTWIAELASTSHDEASLRRRIGDSQPIRATVLAPWDEVRLDAAGDALASPLTALSAGQRSALLTGRSVLTPAVLAPGGQRVYLAHALTLAGRRFVGFFELSGGWLWQGYELGAQNGESIVILDAQGSALQASGTPDAWLRTMLLRWLPQSTQQAPPGALVMQGWQQHGRAWRVALQSIGWDATRVSSAGPWLIAAYGRSPNISDITGLLLPGLLAALGVGLLGLVAASVWATHRWQRTLQMVLAGLRSLSAGAFQRVEVRGAGGITQLLADSYDRAINELQQRLSAQACLAEIDRVLLESGELEQALEPILQRVRTLSGAQVATMALLDRDAPAHARSFSVTAEAAECAVRRVHVDEEFALQLRGASRELSVPAHHLLRYGCLAPLQEQGATRFCVWPIMAGERLGALLAVGYRTSAAATHEQLSLATECAARLRFALTHAERGEHLYRQAHFDSLTALPNRVLFRDRLAAELRRAADSGTRGALLYVDLDHFKQVNDSIGHVGGDQLLTIVAQRLRGCVKDGDTVARLGGDEFTVLLRDLPATEAAAEIARRIIELVQRPVNIAGRDYRVRASIGITVFPDDADTLETVMRNADLAMYQAKDAGRSRAVFFDSQTARTHSSLAHSGLYRALHRHEFALHYQPQFQLRDGGIVGVEALLRWPSSQQGMRLPRDFLPMAEQSGLIVDLGAWVLESACRQLASWRESCGEPIRLALNVSLQQLRLGDFPQLVGQNLQRTGLPAQALELDFTEDALTEQRTREVLRALADLGVRLALDDFGAGDSSLNRLRQHPFHAVKIDASFLQEVPDDARAAKLAATIIDMAHTLGKQVIAEGVESLAQLQFLREHQCDFAQGFVLARPLPAAQLEELLMEQRGAGAAPQQASG